MSRSASVKQQCSSNLEGVALPVLRAPRIRKSRATPWRAAMLITVHILFAVHLAHWWRAGVTISPVEPSESMELSKHDLINAGAIFFGLAILSTLLLGRWFCGWGCHLVALQDLSRWLLARVGIRPKPLRSTTLTIVPLLAFLYMFIAPWIYRALAGDAFQTPRLQVMTSNMWATFPTWIPALLTFLICGFVAIYLLGAKGFCTTACPYGGIFGVADQLSPLRIRVTDACEGCGHCTAVCTSNVRVHEEVRDFKMVVDPGCMKCLDCVSVCPNHALYVGFGPIALKAPTPQSRTRNRKPNDLSRASLTWMLRAVFVVAALTVFIGFDRAYVFRPADAVVIAVLSAVALGIAWIFAGRRRSSPRQLDQWDEITLAIGFLVAMLISRDLGGMVGFLFSLGLSAILAFLAQQGVRMLRAKDQSLHGFRLKRGGRLLLAGYGFVGILFAIFIAGVAGAAVQQRQTKERYLAAAQREIETALRAAPSRELLERAASVYAERVDLHPTELGAYLNLGMTLTSLGRFDDAKAAYDRALEHFPDDARLRLNIGILAAQRGDIPGAVPHFEAAIATDPTLVEARLAYGQALGALSRWSEALDQYLAARDARPDLPDAWLGLAIAQANSGNLNAAIETLNAARQRFPSTPEFTELLRQLGAVEGHP